MAENKKENEIEKGCGKEFLWIKYLNDKRICGQMEDLKHSEHIILCPECIAREEGFNQGSLSKEKEVLRIIDEWLSIFVMDANCPFCIAQYSKLEEIRKEIEGN